MPKVKVKHLLKVLGNLNPEAYLYISSMKRDKSGKVFITFPLKGDLVELAKRGEDESDIIVLSFDPEGEFHVEEIHEVKEDNQ